MCTWWAVGRDQKRWWTEKLKRRCSCTARSTRWWVSPPPSPRKDSEGRLWIVNNWRFSLINFCSGFNGPSHSPGKKNKRDGYTLCPKTNVHGYSSFFTFFFQLHTQKYAEREEAVNVRTWASSISEVRTLVCVWLYSNHKHTYGIYKPRVVHDIWPVTSVHYLCE